MKLVLILVLCATICFAAYEEHTFTMGIDNQLLDCDEEVEPFDCEPYYQPQNYREEGSIDIDILYTTNFLQTKT